MLFRSMSSRSWSIRTPSSKAWQSFDEGLVRADVARAQQVADAVIVAMHWGTEYHTEINDEQVYWAGVLADLKVDLVLGSHAHSIQPVERAHRDGRRRRSVVFVR